MAPAKTIDHLFIVGAGFSHYAGLPLTSSVTDSLLDISGLRLDGPSTLQVNFLKQFVADVFSQAKTTPANFWPYLEDIFTCIDLSANTGHNLGPRYSPSELRTVRRALIVRIIRMLRSAYMRGRKAHTTEWHRLERFFTLIDPANCAFLSMNWDTVIEERVSDIQHISSFDYGCDAMRARFDHTAISIVNDSRTNELQILKPHGSANWLYCDACRQIFWFSPRETNRIAAQLFKSSDWNVVRRFTGRRYPSPGKKHECPNCKALALGTRFATFSYRKALDFPMHEASWRTAERLLNEASTWTFIGYSLPPADYDFKHLLKRVQLSRITPSKLILVTGGDASTAGETQSTYQKFFGPQLKASAGTVFMKGLDNNAIRGLQRLGSLTR